MPVVTTLHTVLAKPTPIQHDVTRRIIDASAKIVIMSETARELLRSLHDVPAHKIDVMNGAGSEEHTSELQTHLKLLSPLLLEKKKTTLRAQTQYHSPY